MAQVVGAPQRVLVIGGGIAGLSIAARVSPHFDVTVVEAEFQPGYHSSGRSAAVYHKPFENDVVHRLSLASESFFKEPPRGFGTVADSIDHLQVADEVGKPHLDRFFDTWIERCPWLERVEGSSLRDRVPILASHWRYGVNDSHSLTLEVHELLDGFRRQLIENRGSVLHSHRLQALDDSRGFWSATFTNGKAVEADIVVNAAGAWADEVADFAGLKPLGLEPRRRTGIRVDPKVEVRNWPMCYFTNQGLYFKPEGDVLMASPVDATLSEPCDAQPEILDVALTVDRLNHATTLEFERPLESWAGLRTFVSDGIPVLGFDRDHDGFFWYAAFAGCGFQTAPAASELARRMLCREPVVEDLGVLPQEVASDRFSEVVHRKDGP